MKESGVFKFKLLHPIAGQILARSNPDKTISVFVVFGPPRFSDLGNRGQFVVKVTQLSCNIRE